MQTSLGTLSNVNWANKKVKWSKPWKIWRRTGMPTDSTGSPQPPEILLMNPTLRSSTNTSLKNKWIHPTPNPSELNQIKPRSKSTITSLTSNNSSWTKIRINLIHSSSLSSRTTILSSNRLHQNKINSLELNKVPRSRLDQNLQNLKIKSCSILTTSNIIWQKNKWIQKKINFSNILIRINKNCSSNSNNNNRTTTISQIIWNNKVLFLKPIQASRK